MFLIHLQYPLIYFLVRYVGYPLEQVRHISYQLSYAVKVEEQHLYKTGTSEHLKWVFPYNKSPCDINPYLSLLLFPFKPTFCHGQ